MLLELVRVALGKQQKLSHPLAENEWLQLFNTAIGQAVAGICCAGIEKLPVEQRPPLELLYQWIALAASVQKQNELMDKRSAKVWKKMKEAGLDAAVLKGQGVATEYG